MTMTMYCVLRAVGSPSNGPSAPKGAWLSAEKVLVMMTKVDCKTVRIFAYSSTREQSNKRSGTRLKTESETWGETLFFLSPHTPARALRTRKTLTARFTDFFTDFEKKTDCFAVYDES